MEMRQEQQPRQRQRQTAMQTAMQNQSHINQEVAVALERLNGRMENLETWREERDRERERAEERKDSRIEKVPDMRRADLAILISAVTALIYLVTLLSQHWKP